MPQTPNSRRHTAVGSCGSAERCRGDPRDKLPHREATNRWNVSMGIARHPRPAELQNAGLDEIMDRYVARFADRNADWAAFEDAKIEGYKRAQHRFIGAGDRKSTSLNSSQ